MDQLKEQTSHEKAPVIFAFLVECGELAFCEEWLDV
jgi:hypothetical protein